MKISCPSCQAKYSIADEKVNDRLAKIRCRKCGANIVIDGKVNPPNVYTAAGDGPDAAAADGDASTTQYSVDFGEGDQRNMGVSEIVAAYNNGQVTAETFVWADGFADWKPLGEVEELVEALNSGGQAKQPSPWGAPAAAAPRAAARGRGGAADLFGRIESAGSEEEVTTSAPEPAFGGGGGASAGSGSTGARNESSVLFSLSALTSASSPGPSRTSSRPGPSASSAAHRDDSGLIDLKALTAAATKTEAAAAPIAAPMMASPLGMAPPLGLASPLGNPLAVAVDQEPQKSKTPLILGICLVLAALVVALAILFKPQPPPPPPTIVVTQAAPPPAPVPTPEPVVTAPPAASVASDSSDKKTSGAKRSSGGGAVGAKKATSGGATPPSGGGDSSPPPPPKKKSGGCGCAPGDLMCNMACSAK